MMLTSPELTCSFVTVHVGYGDVPGLLTVRRIRDVIELTAAAMQRIRGRAPRLAVCGLNPHAGENGLFGQREEERFIVPAIRGDSCPRPVHRRTFAARHRLSAAAPPDHRCVHLHVS